MSDGEAYAPDAQQAVWCVFAEPLVWRKGALPRSERQKKKTPCKKDNVGDNQS